MGGEEGGGSGLSSLDSEQRHIREPPFSLPFPGVVLIKQYTLGFQHY